MKEDFVFYVVKQKSGSWCTNSISRSENNSEI